MIWSGIGKTPAIDWLVIWMIFAFLVIIAIAWSVVQFAVTKQTLKAEDSSAAAAPQPVSKSQEQEAMDILEMYRAKTNRHQELLGTAKTETAAQNRNNPSVGTSSATTTHALASSTNATR